MAITSNENHERQLDTYIEQWKWVKNKTGINPVTKKKLKKAVVEVVVSITFIIVTIIIISVLVKFLIWRERVHLVLIFYNY